LSVFLVVLHQQDSQKVYLKLVLSIPRGLLIYMLIKNSAILCSPCFPCNEKSKESSKWLSPFVCGEIINYIHLKLHQLQSLPPYLVSFSQKFIRRILHRSFFSSLKILYLNKLWMLASGEKGSSKRCIFSTMFYP
jgi:hypothetical protein